MLQILLVILAAEYLLVAARNLKLQSHDNYELHGVHLKFAVYHVPPYNVLTLQPNGNYTHTGSSAEICKWLGARLNFTYSNVILNETAITEFGTENGLLIHLMENKEVDGSAKGLIATPERKAKIDFPAFMWIEPYCMVVPKPREEPRLFAFIWPFQPLVWILVLLTMFVMMSFMNIFSKLSRVIKTSIVGEKDKTTKQRKQSLFENASFCAIYIVNTVTNQGMTTFTVHLSFRILVGTWLLISIVLVNSYSSTVISYLTVPKMKPHINTFEDLAANKEIGLILLKDTVIAEQILGAKSGVLKILGDQARLNSKRILHLATDVTRHLQTGSFAFPYLQTFCELFVINSFKKEAKCRFEISDPLPIQGIWSFALQKNSKFTPSFNKALIELWETGLTTFWVNSIMPQTPRCLTKTYSEANLSGQTSIHLIDLVGIFVVLGVGVILSTCVFFVEILIHLNCQHEGY